MKMWYNTPNMNQLSEASVFPTVSIDTSYSGLVDSIDVDLEAITAHLRAKGMMDEEILGLSLHLAKETSVEASHDDGYRLYGKYLRGDKTIEIYKPDNLFAFTGPITADSKDIMNINSDKRAGSETTGHLVHELEHFVLDDDNETKVIERAHRESIRTEFIKKSVVSALGTFVLGVAMSVGINSSVVGPRIRAFGDLLESGASGNEVFTEGAITAGFGILGLGVVALSGFLAARNFSATLDAALRKQYVNSPEEIKARHAAEVYGGQPMVTFVAKKERIDDLTPIIATLLGKFGEFEATTDGPVALH
jgi:hypothetical protein